ncbi:hypothetical protein ABT186_01615 [Streptomyces sp. NPDC001634]|uniref:hypothetical protein n=1 Tax=Streptomyces sp. NPDC001634 TaxID=3154390 RepID=UPI003332B5BC
MTADRLTPQREAEIREVVEHSRGWAGAPATYTRMLHDLLAELAAVRKERDEARAANLHTPRICACGHGHLAHTVPAPHSCFAYGQTCPCPAYRQLPHDEAVAQLDRNRQAAADRAREDEEAAR